MKYENDINKKVIANAQSSYFMPIVTIAFLFSWDININHPFVRWHVKTASFIHLLFFIVYLIFIQFAFMVHFSFFSYRLNYILTSIFFLFLFWALIYCSEKAHKWEVFWIWDMIKISSWEKWFISWEKKENLNEEDKLTLILSSIPLIWIFIYGKNYKDSTIENISKFNIFISFFISLIYISGNKEVANIFLLFYIIFIVFSSIMIITQWEMIALNMKKIFHPYVLYNFLKDIFSYLKTYFWKEKFKDFSSLRNEKEEKRKIEEEKKISTLQDLGKSPFNEKLIYFPIFNFLFLKRLHTKKYFHIVNAFWISIILILSWIFLWFTNMYQLLLIFPLLYGIAFLETKENYKLAFFFDIWNMFVYILKRIKSLFKKTKEIKKKEEVVSLKIEE